MGAKIILLLGILTILSLTLVSGEIILSQPSAIYNLGDNLETQATVKPSSSQDSFFELNLECGNETKNFYKNPLSLEAGKSKNIESSLSLTKSFLGDMRGFCKINAEFGNEQEASQMFKISDKIDVSLSIENMTAESGKQIEIKGSAVKENGKKIEGFVEISVENGDVKSKYEVSQGSFAANFVFPKNIKSGNYILRVRVYDENLGEELNSGEKTITFNIKKVPSKIEVAILKQNVNPGEKLEFTPLIYDQANEQVEGEISVKIYDVYDSLVFQKLLASGQKYDLDINKSASSGYWRIEAGSLGLQARRLFYVEEFEKAKFEIVNDTLIITNIGNVIYRKAVQISIGDVTEIKDIDLGVGESKKLRLLAPDGNYNIRISDGKEELIVNDIALTGSVVGVEEIRAGLNVFTRYPIVWLFLILVSGLFILMMIQRIAKKSFFSYPAEKKIKLPEKEIMHEKNKEYFVPGKEAEKAEHTLVLHGRKENAGILAIKIKDLKEVKKLNTETINYVIRAIVEAKGTVYETPEFLVGIFASPVTKTFGNDMIAVRVGRAIENILKEHNRKFREKIDYGVSLNSGELILRKDSGMLRFTSLGNTISLSKKLAELSRGELLLSEDIQKRVMNEVKADKEIRNGLNVYKIRSISDRNKHSEFISGFLDRQKAGK